ncbi:acyltransferase-domain-containing protein [Exidia glandulosa HHB12029]|uniref:Tafazzin family protein n=1 Tax=Exidia glandulosa HHB12029 TaxID=1314781 RepID=A0A165Q6D0_EXIGL|nr:acyltransferase-domain-containing protein [Exidia glandulosa HHB12029]
MLSRLLTVATVGLSSKAFLALNTVSVAGLDVLRTALDDRQRGVLTVCNHISVTDDPLTWGIMPISSYFNPRNIRWTLGASDIMFTNPVFSAFFRSGQVIETFRGNGIQQPAIDDAIRKLDAGHWVHLFPEGKVNQFLSPQAQLLRFKWGIGRMLMDVKRTPVVIPMWLTGFDQVMPENRGFPRFLPRPGKRISITFGDPYHLTSRLDDILSQWRADTQPLADAEQASRRIQVTRIVQEEVEKLGYTVISGTQLNTKL